MDTKHESADNRDERDEPVVDTDATTDADEREAAIVGGPTEFTVAGTGGDSPQDNANANAVDAIAEQNEHTAEVDADREAGREND